MKDEGGAERIVPNKGRKLQVAPTERKLFDKARRKVFLEWFAATCNVSLSARQAGIHYRTAFRHRMDDPVFARDWDRALAQGYARLEAQQLQTKAKDGPIQIDGDWDAPEMEQMDPTIALQLLREHKRGLPGGGPPKPGRTPTIASNAEVRAALVKRLKAFGIRVEEKKRGAAGPAGQPSSPAKGGEDEGEAA